VEEGEGWEGGAAAELETGMLVLYS
jgi:hypothetical protein